MAFLKQNYIIKETYDHCNQNIFKGLGEDINLYKRPETYLTILKNEYGNNSKTISLKRKLNQLKKQRIVYDDCLFEQDKRLKLFFVFEKEYFIVTTKKDLFYCNKIFNKEGHLYLEDCYKLNIYDWESQGNIKINNSLVEKCL